MDALTSQLDGFIQLGEYLREIHPEQERYAPLFDCLQKAEQVNGWFNQKNCLLALNAWGETLQADNLAMDCSLSTSKRRTQNHWLNFGWKYSPCGFSRCIECPNPGHQANIKLSSSDPFLIPFLMSVCRNFHLCLKTVCISPKIV